MSPSTDRSLSGSSSLRPSCGHSPFEVLVVEDHLPMQRLLADELRRNGLRVSTALNGEEGLAAVARRRPDVIITDLIMPRVNGLEMAQALRAEPDWCDIPIVMLTGAALPNLGGEAQRAGVRLIIHKPVDFLEVGRVVRRLAGEARARGAVVVPARWQPWPISTAAPLPFLAGATIEIEIPRDLTEAPLLTDREQLEIAHALYWASDVHHVLRDPRTWESLAPLEVRRASFAPWPRRAFRSIAA